MKRQLLAIALVSIGLTACTADEPAAPPAPPRPSIMVLMTDTVTPASDIIWGVEDPQTDAEWQVLDDAAVTLVDAFEATRKGGIGPHDDAWASEAKFQAYIDQEMVALEQARAAIAERNLDGLFDAGGELYTPCEECHIDYNPGVQEQL